MFIDKQFKGLTLKIKGLTKDLAPLLNPYFKQGMTDLLQNAHQEMPYKSGQMARATDVTYEGDLKATIGVDDSLAPHGKFVYGGTRPHVIKPVNAKALQFFPSSGGQAKYSKGVMHPGNKPNPFLLNTWNKHKDEFVQLIESGMKTLIED